MPHERDQMFERLKLGLDLMWLHNIEFVAWKQLVWVTERLHCADMHIYSGKMVS